MPGSSHLRKLVFVSYAVGLILATQLVVGQDLPNEPDKFDDNTLKLMDVFEFELVTDPQISPDGRQIVYQRNQFDKMTDQRVTSIWQIDENENHLPLLSGSANFSSPRWSLDGKRLAFVTNRNGSNQIHCYWLDSKRQTSLTRVTESPSSITWSKNGEWIAFTMRVPQKKNPMVALPAAPKGAKWADAPEVIDRVRYRADGRGFLPRGFSQIFVVSSSGGTPRQITSGEFNHSGPICWADDDQTLIFSANRHPDHDYQPANSEIYEVSLATRTIKQLTDRLGPDRGPAISEDGNTIAFLGYDDKYLGFQANKLYAMNRDGSNVRELIGNLDRNIGSINWTASGQIVFQYDDHGDTKLAVFDSSGQTSSFANRVGGASLGRPYGGGGYSLSKNGVVSFTLTSPYYPADLARTTVAGESPKRLTQLNKDLFAFKKLGEVEEINFKSSHDGEPLQGWIIRPPNFDPAKKYPLILEIHGGPFANYGSRFSAELQLFAAHGYVVLYMNPRGSTSYGQKFANFIHHNYPGNDYEDLMSGVDEVIAKGYVDQKNLYVTGGSGGGVLTAWIIGKTDRFRAAVVAKPVINWYSFALTADMYNYFYKYWFPGLPWDHPEEYMKRSPISLVGNVKTPTMLLTGTADYRTPISETEQYYQALKLQKVETVMVRIPGASHGIASRPSRLMAKVAYILKWFDSHREE